MTIHDGRDAVGALERELHVDLAGVTAQIQSLGGAVEHVIDVLEALTQNHHSIERQLEEARTMLARLW